MSQYLTEILEQPTALLRLYNTWKTDPVLSVLAKAYQKTRPPLAFIGMGSSHYAPTVVRSRLSKANIPFRIEEAGELLHYELDGIPSDAWVIAISQSGESYETKTAAERLRAKVERIIAITNEPKGTLANFADHVLLLHAGREVGSTTKTFLNTLLALHLFTDAITGHPIVTEERLDALVNALARCSDRLKDKAKELVDYFQIPDGPSPEPIHIVARGPMLATALQSALILAETTDLFVSALAGGTFRHGPYELCGPQHRAIFLAPAGKTQDLLINMAKEVHHHGSKVVLLSDRDDDFPFYHLRLPKLSEELAPLLYFLPIELFGYTTALHRNREPGMMRHMGKVTTVE
ncbi:MAG: SIS domain-containing protein [Alicyclobacillus macrosporangiidus]|uniref:SIS domain-containing protein n=1 Tax=Alicyclobacillus macrosporangiidus TaxID=392015 RepID=UPI0026F15B63|nr:SIS domain-containing protein [Alicyclobacillus macrosporangiidus]MCL6600232.1 SIS domain-containing protein [Alicyclobacillus macrosporangiidus]